jgi:hypothetical protein
MNACGCNKDNDVRTTTILMATALGATVTTGQYLASDTTSITTVSFQRLLNTFSWAGAVRYGMKTEGLEMATSQNVKSRLIRSGTSSTQDDYLGQTIVKIPGSAHWKASGQINSSVRRDNRAQELGRLADHRLLVGTEWANPRVLLYGLGGYGIGTQLGRQDAGFSYLIGVQGTDVELEQFHAGFGAHRSLTMLGDRAPESDSLVLSLHRDFGSGAQNQISIGYARQKRQFYTAASQAVQDQYSVTRNIFERDARELIVTDTLHYAVNPDFRLQIAVGVESRTIDRGFRYKAFARPAELLLDSRVEEMNLSGEAHLVNKFTDWLSTVAVVRYQEREERHGIKALPDISESVIDAQERSAKRLANLARRTSVGSRVSLRASADHAVDVSGSAAILRYDTPDLANTDDRDELLFTVGIGSEHVLSRYLTLWLSVDAAFNHLVYLHRFQSANNNWHRVLRFSPKVSYQPTSSFRTTNAAEVLAQYTVYDFEDLAVQIRSFSFRQASWVDSTLITLSPRLALEMSGSLRLYERGILRWAEFRERPQHAFVETSWWTEIVYRMQDHVYFSVGFRYFMLQRYRYEGRTRIFEQRQGSSGPTTEVYWNVPSFGQISLSGWRETQRASAGGAAFSNVTLSANIRI